MADHRLSVASDSTAALAEFVGRTGFSDLPGEVVARAKHVIADTLGVTIHSSLAPELAALTARLAAGEEGRAVILRPGFPTARARTAAFLNATASCTTELDEGSRPTGHPAIHVLPSALALAQELQVSGTDLVTAFVLGYEVQARIQRACRLRPGVHCHGNLGNAAAAAAVGKLSGWDGAALAAGMNAGATFAAATSQSLCHAGATIRNVAVGASAQQAFTVQAMVESGLTAFDGALPEVFGRILGDEFHPEVLSEGLGESYAILTNYTKFHATCGGVHPALDALADAVGTPLRPGMFPWRVQFGLGLSEITAIRVRTSHRDAELAPLPRRNGLSAKFSIPFSMAALLVRGRVDPAAFEGEALLDERVWRLAELVAVEADSAIDARWPAEAVADVTVVLADGRELQGSCVNPYGVNGNAATDGDVERKFRWLLDDVLEQGEIDRLWTWALELDRFADVSHGW